MTGLEEGIIEAGVPLEDVTFDLQLTYPPVGELAILGTGSASAYGFTYHYAMGI